MHQIACLPATLFNVQCKYLGFSTVYDTLVGFAVFVQNPTTKSSFICILPDILSHCEDGYVMVISKVQLSQLLTLMLS